MIRAILAGISLALAAGLICALPGHPQLLQLDDGPVKMSDDVPTPMISWVDEGTPKKGYLLCVHGLGLHKGTYAQFGERMSKLGWGVYACDVRGFGSFQELGKAKTVDFDGAMNDIANALKTVRKQAGGKPVILVGESMGGGLALQVAAAHPELIDGLISSVPGGQRHGQLGDSLKVGMHLLGGGAHKTMDVRKIVVDKSTTNQELKNEWLNDELARFDLQPAELMKFQSFMNRNPQAAKRIASTPVLMISGTDDKLVLEHSNQKLFEEIPCEKKLFVEVDKKEHLLLEEGQFDDMVINQICDFLKAATSS